MSQIIKAFNYILIIVLIHFVYIDLYAQEDNKDVTITASGSGKTLEDAKQAALRSATEQAFGAFISSKTEMFNDVVVADQMASVSSGNIKSYEVLSENQLPEGRWGVTLKVVVSVDNLASFVQAKGLAIEIKGGMFAINIKQQILNEEGEIKAIAELIGLLHEPMQKSFDYIIKSETPKSEDASNLNWNIPLDVNVYPNHNFRICAEYFFNSLRSISLSQSDYFTYQSLNKPVFPVLVKNGTKSDTFYLRKKTSFDAIKSFAWSFRFYQRNFTVIAGLEEVVGKWSYKPKIENYVTFIDLDDNYQTPDEYLLVLIFPSSDEIVSVFNLNDKKTLNQIEQMTGYSVKSRGVISNFKHGGYVVYEEDGHGLVVSLCDIGEGNYETATINCYNLTINGYNDWRLPNKNEFILIRNNVYLRGIGYFDTNLGYWVKSDIQSLQYGEAEIYSPKNEPSQRQWLQNALEKKKVRAVRSF